MKHVDGFITPPAKLVRSVKLALAPQRVGRLFLTRVEQFHRRELSVT